MATTGLGWDDAEAVRAAVAGHHVAGTPMSWQHEWHPLTYDAASSHFHGNVPGSWRKGQASGDPRKGTKLIVVVSKNSRQPRTRALWRVSAADAHKIVNDPRTSLAHSALFAYDNEQLPPEKRGTGPTNQGRKNTWDYMPDNGMWDDLLAEHGVTKLEHHGNLLPAPGEATYRRGKPVPAEFTKAAGGVVRDSAASDPAEVLKMTPPYHGEAVSDWETRARQDWDALEYAGAAHRAAVAGHHVPGTAMSWRHGWEPLSFEAAKSHYHARIPPYWRAPGQDRPDRRSGLMKHGDWHEGHQAVAPAPVHLLGGEHQRYLTVKGQQGKHPVKGAYSDPWWMTQPGGGWAVSRRWKHKEQAGYEWRGGKGRTFPIPAGDERVLTPVDATGNPLSGKFTSGSEREFPAAHLAAEDAAAKAKGTGQTHYITRPLAGNKWVVTAQRPAWSDHFAVDAAGNWSRFDGSLPGRDRLRPVKGPPGDRTWMGATRAAIAGHHVPGSPYEWRHDWEPLSFHAAGAKFHGRVPEGWQAGDVRKRPRPAGGKRPHTAGGTGGHTGGMNPPDLSQLPPEPKVPTRESVSSWDKAGMTAYLRAGESHQAWAHAKHAGELQKSGASHQEIMGALGAAESTAPADERALHAARLDAYAKAHGLKGWYRHETTASVQNKHMVQVNKIRTPAEGDKGRYYALPPMAGATSQKTTIVDRDTGKMVAEIPPTKSGHFFGPDAKAAQAWIAAKEAGQAKTDPRVAAIASKVAAAEPRYRLSAAIGHVVPGHGQDYGAMMSLVSQLKDGDPASAADRGRRMAADFPDGSAKQAAQLDQIMAVVQGAGGGETPPALLANADAYSAAVHAATLRKRVPVPVPQDVKPDEETRARIAAATAKSQAALKSEPLLYGEIGQAWSAAHGGKRAPAAMDRKWAYNGASSADEASAWYQAGMDRKHGPGWREAQQAAKAPLPPPAAPQSPLAGLAAEHGLEVGKLGGGTTVILSKRDSTGVQVPVLTDRGGRITTTNGEEIQPGEVAAYLAAYKEHPTWLSGALLDEIHGKGPGSAPRWTDTAKLATPRGATTQATWGQPKGEKTAGLMEAAIAAAANRQWDKAYRLLEQADTAEAHEGVDSGSGSRTVIDSARQEFKRTQAGLSNAAAMDHNMALAHARRVHLRETTGLDSAMLDARNLKGMRPEVRRDAEAALFAGDFAKVDSLLGGEEQRLGASGITPDKRDAVWIGKARAKIAKAAAKALPAWPPLNKVGKANPDGTLNVVDHTGAKYIVGYKNGTVTVTGGGKTLSGRAENAAGATGVARRLAGRISGQPGPRPAAWMPKAAAVERLRLGFESTDLHDARDALEHGDLLSADAALAKVQAAVEDSARRVPGGGKGLGQVLALRERIRKAMDRQARARGALARGASRDDDEEAVRAGWKDHRGHFAAEPTIADTADHAAKLLGPDDEVPGHVRAAAEAADHRDHRAAAGHLAMARDKLVRRPAGARPVPTTGDVADQHQRLVHAIGSHLRYAQERSGGPARRGAEFERLHPRGFGGKFAREPGGGGGVAASGAAGGTRAGGGAAVNPADWIQDWNPGAYAGGWVPDLTPAKGFKALTSRGRDKPPANGTADDPIDVHGDLNKALHFMHTGQHVRLNQVDEIATLLDKVAAISKRGDGPKGKSNWDFGLLTVKGTNLFTAQTKGIPRIKMPQFGGLAEPGSPAAKLAGGDGKFIDLGDQLAAELRRKGVRITEGQMSAAHLRATQTELVGAKVAGFASAVRAGNEGAAKALKEPIFVTRDGYVVDGHHRWAANMMLDALDGVLGDKMQNVHVIDMDIGAMIPYANEFTQRMGIAGRGGVKRALIAAGGLVRSPGLDWDPRELVLELEPDKRAGTL